MTYKLKTLILLTFLAGTVAARAENPNKAAWLWTDDERLQSRFDPALRLERLAEAKAAGHRPSSESSFMDGRRHPELFFPWELMDSFLDVLIVPPRVADAERETYRPFIEQQGWAFDTFWRKIDEVGAQYAAVAAEQRTPEPKRSSDQRATLAQQLCTARAAALADARKYFGQEAFNEFLYTAVAPRIAAWSSDKRDAATLRRIEAGCK